MAVPRAVVPPVALACGIALLAADPWESEPPTTYAGASTLTAVVGLAAGIGLLVAFSPEERSIAEALEAEGATVERLADVLKVPADKLFPRGPSAMEAIAKHFGLEKDQRRLARRRRAKQAKR